MTFVGRDFSGSAFNFETESAGSDNRPIQRIKYDDILPAFIPGSVNASTVIVPAVSGKIIEIVSIICTANAALQLRLESWDGTTGTGISPSFHVTASKDFPWGGHLGSRIAASSLGQGVRVALVSGTGNFTAWAQYRLV